MTVMKVMIVDDEPLAIERLRDLLHRIDEVQVAGTSENAQDAIDRVPELQPDLIMIDVEMPKVDGFDFVEALAKQGWLSSESAPCICFVTAYPQFATDAFETGALDFLCKPVRLGRLEKTIERARRTIAQRHALARLQELSTQLDSLRESRNPASEPALWVHQRGQMVRVPLETLDWVQAEGEYVRLHARDQSFLLRSSISALADKLSDRGFVRIHRSALVNRERLAAIRGSRSGVKIVLTDDAELPVGRKYRRAVQQLMTDATSY